jgi:hypothetical protein
MTNESEQDLFYSVRVLQAKALNYQPVNVRPIRVELRDIEGKLMPLTIYGKTIRGQCGDCGGGGTLGGLKPGESRSEMVDLNKEFDIKKPGKYTVHAERLDEASKTLVKSSGITVAVVP